MQCSLHLPDKCHDSCLVVLTLPVLQAEVSNFDAGNELHLRHGADLVQLGQDLAGVGCEGHQHRQVREGHQGHVVLGVGPRLGVSDQIDGVLQYKSRV